LILIKNIILDPGHGLSEDGVYSRPLIDCRAGGAKTVNKFTHCDLDGVQDVYREDHGTLLIANETQKVLQRLGYNCLVTRGDKRNAALYLAEIMNGTQWQKTFWKSWKWVQQFALKSKSELFVSIHTNAGGASGCVGFWCEPQGAKLCESICDEISDSLGIKVRKIAQHRYSVLRGHSNGLSILLECLFHDNVDDIKLILTPEGIEKLANAIAIGIDKFCREN
jgi:N-acetylmuramoyl-L-alanine amidase